MTDEKMAGGGGMINSRIYDSDMRLNRIKSWREQGHKLCRLCQEPSWKECFACGIGRIQQKKCFPFYKETAE